MKMKRLILIILFLISLFSCVKLKNEQLNYPLQVGDINFDLKLDNSAFKLCDETSVYQYYNFARGLQYKGEKRQIYDYFKRGFKKNSSVKDSGFLTIRFVVNCKGQLGRFRVQGMSEDYNPMDFDQDISNQMLNLTMKMNGWIIGTYEGIAYDYYQYLTFKIQDGQIIDIMP